MSTMELDTAIEKLAGSGYWPAQARKCFDEKKYSKAAELCLRGLDEEPDIISGRTILARTLYETGQFEPARDQFHEILRRDPANLVALRHLGDLAFRDGEEAAAMAYYRRIFEIDPCCEGLSCSICREEKMETRWLTLRRSGEKTAPEKRPLLREPAFITETVGDIYRDQGYYQLAGEVYRRLLARSQNSRIAEKMKDVQKKLGPREETA